MDWVFKNIDHYGEKIFKKKTYDLILSVLNMNWWNRIKKKLK
jgi:hypothetical protein